MARSVNVPEMWNRQQAYPKLSLNALFRSSLKIRERASLIILSLAYLHSPPQRRFKYPLWPCGFWRMSLCVVAIIIHLYEPGEDDATIQSRPLSCRIEISAFVSRPRNANAGIRLQGRMLDAERRRQGWEWAPAGGRSTVEAEAWSISASVSAFSCAITVAWGGSCAAGSFVRNTYPVDV